MTAKYFTAECATSRCKACKTTALGSPCDCSCHPASREPRAGDRVRIIAAGAFQDREGVAEAVEGDARLRLSLSVRDGGVPHTIRVLLYPCSLKTVQPRGAA